MSGPKIGITGSYGGLNLGDEAILQSIIAQLRHEVPDAEITVFSRDAEDTKRRHKVERAVPVRKLSRSEVVPEVERLDLLLFGGGGILYDADARTYLREVLVAKEHGVPVMPDGLIVAGRCISGTHEAHSSYRVMPIVMATGQAAGVCAALAARRGVMPREVPVREVQRELLRQDASLRPELARERQIAA